MTRISFPWLFLISTGWAHAAISAFGDWQPFSLDDDFSRNILCFGDLPSPDLLTLANYAPDPANPYQSDPIPHEYRDLVDLCATEHQLLTRTKDPTHVNAWQSNPTYAHARWRANLDCLNGKIERDGELGTEKIDTDLDAMLEVQRPEAWAYILRDWSRQSGARSDIESYCHNHCVCLESFIAGAAGVKKRLYQGFWDQVTDKLGPKPKPWNRESRVWRGHKLGDRPFEYADGRSQPYSRQKALSSQFLQSTAVRSNIRRKGY